MAKRELLIVKNVSREGAGLIESILQERQISYAIADLEAGDALPSPQGFAAIMVLGGPDSANDDTPKMRRELSVVGEALLNGVPIMGICLGLQVLVKAAGGEVFKSPRKEVGLHTPEGERYLVELTPEGKKDPLLNGLEPALQVFQLHGETVRLTDSMVLLGAGNDCRNQIVRVQPRAYGVQCHCELTDDLLQDWLREDGDLRVLDGAAVMRDFLKIRDEYIKVGRRLFENFFRIAGLMI
jgi:GMP synthase (glutamine-hydrolysing)